jgi:hypothetical protein
MVNAPGRFWVVKHPSSDGNVIAKFDTPGQTLIPEDVAGYDDFSIIEVSDRSTLASKTIDQSGLTQEELDLISEITQVDQ